MGEVEQAMEIARLGSEQSHYTDVDRALSVLAAEVLRLRDRRIPIGAKDRNGVEICLGDTVRFADAQEWGGALPPPWTVELKNGALYQACGAPSDLPHYCEVVKGGEE